MSRCADEATDNANIRPKLHASPSFITLMEEQQNKRKDLIERQRVEMTTQNNGSSI